MLASERMGYIGSSDVPIILGISTFKSRFQLFLEKTGRVTPPPPTDLMEAGTEQEDYIANRYMRESGEVLVKVGRRVHPDYPFLGAAVDRMILDDDSYGRIAECKMVTIAAQRKWSGVIAPHDYFAQVQHQLFVWIMRRATIIPLFTGMMELDPRDIYADPDYQAMILEKCLEFWGWVERNEEPPALTEEEARLKYVNPQPDTKLVANDELIRLTSIYDELAEQADLVAAELSDAKSQIMTAMGEHTHLVDVDDVPLFRWTPKKTAEPFDKKGLKAEFPEIAKRFTGPAGSTRQFCRVK